MFMTFPLEGTNEFLVTGLRETIDCRVGDKQNSALTDQVFNSSCSAATVVQEMLPFSPEEVLPIPAKCSDLFRQLIHCQSVPLELEQLQQQQQQQQQQQHSLLATALTSSLTERQMPPLSSSMCRSKSSDQLVPRGRGFHSPFGSPNSSPRIQRKPLKETPWVNSMTRGNSEEFMQLKQYKVEGPIGQGSYEIVKLADQEDDINYAMKILSKKKLKRKAGIYYQGNPTPKVGGGDCNKIAENPLQKICREIAILKKLDHPNVVKLFEVLDDPEEDDLYMVFELLEGGEILEIPTNSPLEEKNIWESFRGVILGLEYLHYQNIIHCDLKPSNLLRTTDGLVKIADFGMSSEFDGHDAFLTNMPGTPAFTPPESLTQKPSEEPYSGKAADIWSLGITLYSLVTGKVPFYDNIILSLYNKICTQPLVFPEDRDITPELKDLITQMLIKDPAKRITLQRIKEHDWMTGFGIYPLPAEKENCKLIEVTKNDIHQCIKSVAELDSLVLVKSMPKHHYFLNSFSSLRDRFQSGGRSNSLLTFRTPSGEYYDQDRKLRRSMPILSEEALSRDNSPRT